MTRIAPAVARKQHGHPLGVDWSHMSLDSVVKNENRPPASRLFAPQSKERQIAGHIAPNLKEPPHRVG